MNSPGTSPCHILLWVPSRGCQELSLSGHHTGGLRRCPGTARMVSVPHGTPVPYSRPLLKFAPHPSGGDGDTWFQAAYSVLC